MRASKCRPVLTREQELLQDFQQGEAAEEREQLEPVDKKIRNTRRTWAGMRDRNDGAAASQKAQESTGPITGLTPPKAIG